MSTFKFLSENDDFYNNLASWMFIRREHLEGYDYEFITDAHYGILSFLRQFPNHMIVGVLSIVGPDGICHDANNEGIGWGFNIRTDLIEVTWCRYR